MGVAWGVVKVDLKDEPPLEEEDRVGRSLKD
jgi:hypothetical protein